MKFLGIDPGKQGALACVTDNGDPPEYSVKLGDMTPRDVFRWLAERETSETYAVLELVRSSPQMGVTSAFTFGKGSGVLIGCLAAAAIPYVEVTPAKWQRAFVKPKKADEPQAAHKRKLKAAAQELFPSVKVTLVNADALLLAAYCRRHLGQLF